MKRALRSRPMRETFWISFLAVGVLGSANPALLGQTEPGRPRLTVNASSPTGLGVTPFQMRLVGDPDQTYVIQSTADFATWTSISTNQTDSAGTATVSDPQPSRAGKRFYRAALLRPLVLRGDFSNDRILVKPKVNVDLTLLHMLLGTSVLQSFPAIGGLQVVRLPAGAVVDVIITAFVNSGLVQYAEPDAIVHALLTPNDFRYFDGSLWGLNNTGQSGGVPDADIDAPESWDVQNTASSVIVAVIDTGVRTTHEDIAPNLWVNPANGSHGINAINDTNDPNDDFGHGTHVAGTLGAVGNNNVGIVGVCWDVQIMACKFLDPQGNGTLSDAIQCIDFARANGARVINASWGTTTFTSQALRDAIASVGQAGIIFVAAAGNSAGDNDSDPLYPASYDLDNIVSVAATTRTDGLANFSNFGATTVDLGAPGVAIFSCWNGADTDYRFLDGTSTAAPHVAGACALLRAHFPGDSYRQIIDRILSNVDPLPALAGKCVSGGRLNLQKALGATTPPTLPTVTVTANDGNASESGPDAGTFSITRMGDTTGPLLVNYAIGGTASNGTDYQQLSTSVTISAGASSATVTVTPLDDTETEGSETVVLTLTANATYSVGSPGTATVTLADNEASGAEPVITLTASDPNASETGADTGVITFHRTGDTSQAIQVNWTFSGTAVNGSDYQQLPTSSTFPAGLADAPLTITPIDDTAVEGNETVTVTLAPGDGYTIGSSDSATLTIADNDQPSQLPVITVTATDANASEAGDAGTFTVSRSGSTTASLTVDYSLAGTAGNGTDYQELPGSVTIAAGSSSANITVTPINDTAVEGNETVVLTLSANAAYTVGSPNNASVTIADDDQAEPVPTVTVAASDANASESGDAGTFNVSRSGSTASALTVFYSMSGSAGNGADYQTLSGSVTISQGASSANITVTPIDDTAVEGDETVGLTLAGNSAYTVGSPSSATVTIADNDQTPPPLPTVTVTATDTNATEDGDTGEFAFSRTGSTANALTINFTLSGTATKWVDYRRPEGDMPESVTIPVGASSTTMTIVAVDDTEVEGDETAILTIAPDAAYTVGTPDSATITLHDNQPPPLPTVTVTASDANASESGDAGRFTVSRSGSTASALTVFYAMSGSAGNGADYQTLSGSVTISQGASSANITVTPIDDTAVEGNEAAVLTLSANAAYTVGSPNSATVTLADNDQPPPLPTVTVTASDANASEAGDAGRFTVARSGSTASALTVFYSMSGNAGNGADYQTLSGSVTISAGASSANIAVTPIDDTAVEGNETVVLTLSANAAYTVGSPNSATVTLADNDQPPPPLTADFTASPLLGIVPLIVQFTDHSTGNPVSWDWNFGDGSPHSSAQNPSHIYILPGTYTVTLTVRNSAGATSSKSVTVRASLL